MIPDSGDHDCEQICSVCSFHSARSPVDSTHLKDAQNRHRNGITTELLSLGVDPLSRRPGRMHPVERLPQKRKQTEALLYGR
jgi:hypothetical protein